jgi:hypothetical protein
MAKKRYVIDNDVIVLPPPAIKPAVLSPTIEFGVSNVSRQPSSAMGSLSLSSSSSSSASGGDENTTQSSRQQQTDDTDCDTVSEPPLKKAKVRCKHSPFRHHHSYSCNISFVLSLFDLPELLPLAFRHFRIA